MLPGTGSKGPKMKLKKRSLEKLSDMSKVNEPERAGTGSQACWHKFDFFFFFDNIWRRGLHKERPWSHSHLRVLPTACCSRSMSENHWVRGSLITDKNVKELKERTNREKRHYEKQCEITNWRRCVARTVMPTTASTGTSGCSALETRCGVK